MNTRGFRQGLESVSLIPMADNLNHKLVSVNFDQINLDYHTQAEKAYDYYSIEKYLNDYSTIYNEIGKSDVITLNELNKCNIKGRFNWKTY